MHASFLVWETVVIDFDILAQHDFTEARYPNTYQRRCWVAAEEDSFKATWAIGGVAHLRMILWKLDNDETARDMKELIWVKVHIVWFRTFEGGGAVARKNVVDSGNHARCLAPEPRW